MRKSLDEMATFVEVVNCGSFSKAAEKTGIPVSTVSRRVADLEGRLKVQLLHRSTRTQRLSDIGRVYFNHCSQMLREAESAELAVQNLKAEPSGVLRIHTPYVFDDPYASNMMQEFLLCYPKISVDYIVSLRKIDLIEELFDCALIPGHLNDSAMRTRGLGNFKLSYCASPAYIEQFGLPDVRQELNKHYFVKVEYPNWMSLPGNSVDAEFICRLKTNDIQVARRSAVGGIGLTCLPTMFIQKQLTEGSLVSILPELALEAPFNIVFPGSKQFTTKLRAFINHMADYSAKFAPWNK